MKIRSHRKMTVSLNCEDQRAGIATSSTVQENKKLQFLVQRSVLVSRPFYRLLKLLQDYTHAVNHIIRRELL